MAGTLMLGQAQRPRLVTILMAHRNETVDTPAQEPTAAPSEHVAAQPECFAAPSECTAAQQARKAVPPRE